MHTNHDYFTLLFKRESNKSNSGWLVVIFSILVLVFLIMLFVFCRPMNFLVDPVYRFPYIMIFGVLAIDLIAFVQDVSKAPSEIANNMYLDILYKICKRILSIESSIDIAMFHS